MKDLMGRFKRLASKIAGRMPVAVVRRRPRSDHPADRYTYQKDIVDFDIRSDERVLDIGSGGHPFPMANVLVDMYPEDSPHRVDELRTDGREFIQADLNDLPFEDGEFDYVYCSHVLEHVEDPIAACAEIMRVGRRGYIETPTYGKDVLFAQACKVEHRWHVVGIGANLVFFEYTERQKEGIRSAAFENMILDRSQNDVREAYYANQDVFNCCFPWNDEFGVYVFRLDGSIDSNRK